MEERMAKLSERIEELELSLWFVEKAFKKMGTDIYKIEIEKQEDDNEQPAGNIGASKWE